MIIAYDGYTSNDYTKMGLGVLRPISCTVTEKAGGSYELEMEHPVDPAGRWEWLATGNLIKAPCPVIDVGSTTIGANAEVWKTTTTAELYSQPNAPTRLTYPQWVISTPYNQGSKVTYSGKNYQSTQILMDHEIHIAPPNLPSKWKRIQDYTSGSSEVASLAANVECYVISKYSTSWNLVRTMAGNEGYLQTSKSSYVRTEVREPVEPRIVTDQLFRIYKTEINTEQTKIKVNAQHVSYDLAGTLLGECQISKLTPSGAVSRIKSTMLEPAESTIATNIPDTAEPFTADFSYKNPVYALLDPKEGIVPFYGAMVVRDNWDFFVLENEAPDRGFSITYGVNLRGVTWKSDTQNVITRIVPIAKAADDTDLLLPEINVDSVYIGSYPTPIAQSLKVDGKVGGDDGQGGTWTEQTLYAYMREQAQAQFDAGCDLPTEDITVEFQLLGETVEYSQYKALEKLFLYDTVTVKHPEIRLNRKLQVSETRWDAIREAFEAITLSSSLDYSGITIAGFQIASGAITAKNMGRSSVGMDQIVQGAVIARSIAAGAVSADKIQAGAVNADKIAAGAIEAGKIAAGAVTADKISAGAVTADKIGAGEVTAAKLAADVFTAVDAEIQSANIGYAQIKDASVQNFITKDAIADRYYIQKLMVQNLQVIEQTVQNLVVKASNGNYYRLDVNENTGAVTPTQVTVTAGEISAGVTTSGRSIIDTDILASDLSATNIKGANALIDRITASRLDVAELFARQATISQLNTVDISSNESLQIQAQNQIDLSIGNISIGGTNWLEKSDDYLEVTGPSGNTSFQFAFGDIAGHWSQFRGKQITVSFDIELVNATGNGTGVFIQPQFWYSDSTYQNFEIVYALNSTPLTLSTRATKTFTVQDKALDHVAQSGIYIYGLTGGRVKVGRPKLEIGNKPTDWTPAPTELKNSSIDISREGISILTDGVLKIAGQTEGSFLLPNGGMTAMNGDFSNLAVGGTRVIGSGAEAFLLPILCKFTQGSASPPSGHNFLWINASGSSFTSASRSGPTSVGYLPRTFTLNAPDNTLANGTFTYTLKFGVTNRQGSNPDSVTGTVTATINGVTFSSGSITVRKWETKNLEITVSSTTNLFASSGTLSVAFTQTHSGGGLGFDLDGSTMTLTALKSGTSGTQDVSIKYVP